MSWCFGDVQDRIVSKGGTVMNQKKTGEFLKELRKERGEVRKWIMKQKIL